MNIENVLASVTVKDLAAATKWYEAVFQRPPDSRPMPEVAEWHFPRGGWLQVYHLPERAGGCSCTFAIDDLDRTVAHLRELGVEKGEVRESEKTLGRDDQGTGRQFARLRRGVRSIAGALTVRVHRDFSRPKRTSE